MARKRCANIPSSNTSFITPSGITDDCVLADTNRFLKIIENCRKIEQAEMPVTANIFTIMLVVQTFQSLTEVSTSGGWLLGDRK